MSGKCMFGLLGVLCWWSTFRLFEDGHVIEDHKAVNMLGSQQFCVRWNSYQTNLQDVFPKLLNNEHFVDVTLACEAQMIKCHKVVLSACSTYFEQLLVQNPCQHPIIFMKDMRHWEVQALVDFMYKGEVNVSQEELASLLKAAEALQIRGLCGADRQQDGNSVSLPPETTLSDSGGRETPPAKRRKFPEQPTERREKQSTTPSQKPNNATSSSTSASATPTSSNNDLAAVLGVSGPITASVTSTPFRESDRNNSSKEIHPEELLERSNIKREHLDQDESYFENDGDYESFDIQEDSNSMNPDISMPTSPMDQAGPSGMAGSQGSDKSTAVWHHLERVLSSTARRGRPKRDDPSLKAAAHLVMDRRYTLRQAALQFQIPPTTLRNYMKRSGMLRMPLKRGRPVSSSSSYHFYSEPFMPSNYMNASYHPRPNHPQYPVHQQHQYHQQQYQQQQQQQQQQHHPTHQQPQQHHQQHHSQPQQQFQQPQQHHQQHSTPQQQQQQPPAASVQQQYGFNNDFTPDFNDFGSEFCDIQELRPSKVENTRTSSPVEIDLDSEPDGENANVAQADQEGQTEEVDDEGDDDHENDAEDDDGGNETHAAQMGHQSAGSDCVPSENPVENAESEEDQSDSDSESEESDGEQGGQAGQIL